MSTIVRRGVQEELVTVGTGGVFDSNTIQGAIDIAEAAGASASNPHVVYIAQPGIYTVTDRIRIKSSGIAIVGEGRDAVMVKRSRDVTPPDSKTQGCIVIGHDSDESPTATQQNVSLEELTVIDDQDESVSEWPESAIQIGTLHQAKGTAGSFPSGLTCFDGISLRRVRARGHWAGLTVANFHGDAAEGDYTGTVSVEQCDIGGTCHGVDHRGYGRYLSRHNIYRGGLGDLNPLLYQTTPTIDWSVNAFAVSKGSSAATSDWFVNAELASHHDVFLAVHDGTVDIVGGEPSARGFAPIELQRNVDRFRATFHSPVAYGRSDSAFGDPDRFAVILWDGAGDPSYVIEGDFTVRGGYGAIHQTLTSGGKTSIHGVLARYSTIAQVTLTVVETFLDVRNDLSSGGTEYSITVDGAQATVVARDITTGGCADGTNVLNSGTLTTKTVKP